MSRRMAAEKRGETVAASPAGAPPAPAPAPPPPEVPPVGTAAAARAAALARRRHAVARAHHGAVDAGREAHRLEAARLRQARGGHGLRDGRDGQALLPPDAHAQGGRRARRGDQGDHLLGRRHHHDRGRHAASGHVHGLARGARDVRSGHFVQPLALNRLAAPRLLATTRAAPGALSARGGAAGAGRGRSGCCGDRGSVWP